MNKYIKSAIQGLLIVGMFPGILHAQQSWYISASGNDHAAGSSPATAWKSLAKINSSHLSAGDKIFLRRGDVFKGDLVIKTSDLIVNAYGKGDKPVISGAENISSVWKLNKGKIWETTIADKPSEITGFFKKGSSMPLSRYPNMDVNNGYLNFESHSSASQFTDKQLTSAINWSGTEVVVRAELFRLVRTRVLEHIDSVISFEPTTSIARLRDGFGYFFVNDIKAIDREGEWAYVAETGKIYMYSSTDPNKSKYSYAGSETLLLILGAANVQVKNIKFNYAAKTAIAVTKSSGILIDSTDIINSGGDGIIFNGSKQSIVQNSKISRVNWSGIFSTKSCDDILIKNNDISTIGNMVYGKSKTFIGIDCNSSNSKIINNTVSSTGYTGIICCGENNLVKRNVIDSVCQFLEDMGAIYTNNNINKTTGTVIEENIITNSHCMPGGGKGEFDLANGIYLDNKSQGVTVRNNTIAFISGSGIFIHATLLDNKIYDNTSYESGVSEFYITNPDIAPFYDVQRNILVNTSKDAMHSVLQSGKTGKYSFGEIGTFKGNYIINPYADKNIKVTYKEGEKVTLKMFSVAEWETVASPYVSDNKISPLSLKANEDVSKSVKFFYNNTDKFKNVSLPTGEFTDVKNKRYSKMVSLNPFSSVVLFKN